MLVNRNPTEYLTSSEKRSLMAALDANGYKSWEERCRIYLFMHLFSLVAETLFSESDGSPPRLACQLALKVLMLEKVYFAPHVAEPLLSYLRTCHQMRFESAIVNTAHKYALVPYKTTYSLIETARLASFFDAPVMFHD